MKLAEKISRTINIFKTFKKEEFENYYTRKSIEETLKNVWGAKQAQELVKALERNGILPPN